MTRNWYIEHGYKLSSLIDEAEIARAEADVVDAYIEPIVGDKIIPAETRQETIGALAFLLLSQRNIFVTRAGAKTKTGYNSANADAWAGLQQDAHVCHAKLNALRRIVGGSDAEVDDICKIYFKTNFISM